MFFQIDIIFIDTAVKARLYLPDGGSALVYLTILEHERLVANGFIRMFDQPDSAGVLGTSKMYQIKP